MPIVRVSTQIHQKRALGATPWARAQDFGIQLGSANKSKVAPTTEVDTIDTYFCEMYKEQSFRW